jgi:acyl-CoA thioester hydrolase
MGHMNVMWYVGKFDEATWQLLSLIGLTSSRMQSENLAAAALEQHNHYRRELHAGDAVTIRSAIVEVKDKTIRIRHEMTHDDSGELAAASTIVGVQLDRISRKACSLPLDVRQRAGLFLSTDGELTETTIP